MWLILQHEHDEAAKWAARELADQGCGPVLRLTDAELGSARRWEHRLEGTHTSIRCELADGRYFDGSKVDAVLNRLLFVSPVVTGNLRSVDRPYAMQEWNAFFLSWLSCLTCPVLNPPSPLGLSGAFRHPLEWRSLAFQAGFDAPGPAFVSRNNGAQHSKAGLDSLQVLLVGTNVISLQPLPPEVKKASIRLGALARTPLLGLRLRTTPNGAWEFLECSTTPDLRTGGENFIRALGDTFRAPSLTWKENS